MDTLLFLCTGNYYRSRFAELLFNAQATAHSLTWQADSRGLALEMGVGNVGPISRTALDALHHLGVAVTEPLRYPRQVTVQDLQQARLVIALKEAEHRPYLRARYPAWEHRVEYWHVHDGLPTLAYHPLQEIESEVRRLIQRLSLPA